MHIFSKIDHLWQRQATGILTQMYLSQMILDECSRKIKIEKNKYFIFYLGLFNKFLDMLCGFFFLISESKQN